MAEKELLQQKMPNPASFSEGEILSALIENGMVDSDGVHEAMNKKMLNYVTGCHSHTIWKGDDGRWRTYLPDADKPKGRKLVSRESYDALIKLLYEFYIGAEEMREKLEMTLEMLFPEWQEEKRIHVTESTVKRDKTTWRAMYDGEDITKKPIVSLTKEEIERWMLNKIREKDMNAHQYNNFSSVFRQLMSYAEEREIIEKNPYNRVRIRKRSVLKPEVKKPSETEVFTSEEREVLVKYAFEQYKQNRYKVQIFTPLAIAFLLYTGLRRGEVTALRFEDMYDKQLILSDSYSHDMKCLKGKLKDGAGWRNVYIVPAALKIIELVRTERERLGLPTDGFIFSVNEKLDSFYSSIGKAINNFCDELGIRRRSIHKTRKTVASMMHANGVDDLIIQKQLGHKDLRTTQQCYCYDLTTDEERYSQIAKSLA